MFCDPRYVIKKDKSFGVTGNTADSTISNPTAAAARDHPSPRGSEEPGSKRIRYTLTYEPTEGTAAQHSAWGDQRQASAIASAAQQVPTLQQRSQSLSADAGQPESFAAASTGDHRRSSIARLPSLATAAAGDQQGPGFAATTILTPYPEVPHAPAGAAAVAVLPDAADLATTNINDDIVTDVPAHLLLPSLPATATADTSASPLPEPPPASQPDHPVGYWEDRYQLPYAALRSHWPDPALVQLLTQQSDCLYDFNLPALLTPAIVAAVEAAAAARASSSASSRATAAERCKHKDIPGMVMSTGQSALA